MKRYTYCVVTSNGAGVHSRDHGSCAGAKAAAKRLAERDATQRVKFGPFEIERVEHVNGSGGRRYWMRQRGRWVPWDPNRDATVRQPDWIYGEASRG